MSGAVVGQLGSLYTLGAAGSLTDGQLLERFLTRDDPVASEAAFTALVDRHGAMVLAVCRRELGDLHEAHDAFQATFLVLVSKASTIRRRESVGGWLLGIARRVAARARVEGARRRRHLEQLGAERVLAEETAGVMTPSESEPDFAPLLAEVDRLPEPFRAPVVLHYFEGLSAEATAQRLGCARGTVLSRLSRARDRIKRRLERQGVSYPAVIPLLGSRVRWLPPEPVPASLAQATIRAAGTLALAGTAVESVVPASVAGLSRRVARTLALSRVGAAAALFVIAATSVSIALATTLPEAQSSQGHDTMPKPQVATTRGRGSSGDEPGTNESVRVRVRVLDPDGKPAIGAEIWLYTQGLRPDGSIGARRVGTAGPGGRFELEIPRTSIVPLGGILDHLTPKSVLGARSPGFGLDWAAIWPDAEGEPITLRLRRDDIPIEGRIINLEGRPVPGVTAKVVDVIALPPGLLPRVRENGGKLTTDQSAQLLHLFVYGADGPMSPARTGPDGRFRMTGIGRDRLVHLVVEGAPVERTHVMVLTSDDPAYKPILLPADIARQTKVEGPRFQLAVAPGRVVEGTVRDRETGRPIAGASVRTLFGDTLKTDAKGRFRFEGQRKAVDNVVHVSVDSEPYVSAFKRFKDTNDLTPVRLEFALKRGVWAEGRATDASTGRPVKAIVAYHPSRDNPHIKDVPDASFLSSDISDDAAIRTDAEGRYRTVVLAGRGLLRVRASEHGYQFVRPLDAKAASDVLEAVALRLSLGDSNALVPIEASAGKGVSMPDIALEPGRAVRLRIADPDGKAVRGSRAFCVLGLSPIGEPVESDEFRFVHVNPGKVKTLVIVHEGRSLAGWVDLKGDEADPVQVVLRPTGTVTGRLVDEEGKPLRDTSLLIAYHITRGNNSESARWYAPPPTGPDGRFCIKKLVPGLSYSADVLARYRYGMQGRLQTKPWTLRSGEVQDWGDVRVERYAP
jgi:RNA polymerase sigma factor (sigma-70 family)